MSERSPNSAKHRETSYHRCRCPNKANTALDRIEIPQDVVDRVSELLTPASSVIISDYGISHETGKNTDFIVVTH